MENNPHSLTEQLIMDRQGVLLRTFYKTILAITAANLVLLAFLPGYVPASELSTATALVSNMVAIRFIGVLYWLVQKGYVVISIAGAIFLTAAFGLYTVFIGYNLDPQLLATLYLPVCVAGMLPRRRHFWMVYALNVGLLLTSLWLVANFQNSDVTSRTVLTALLILTVLALLVDLLSNAFRTTLRNTFSQQVELRQAEERLTQLDSELELAVNEQRRAESFTDRSNQVGNLPLEALEAGSISIDGDRVELSEGFATRYNIAPATSVVALQELIEEKDRDRFTQFIQRSLSANDRTTADFQLSGNTSLYWRLILEPESSTLLKGIAMEITSQLIEKQAHLSPDASLFESQKLESMGTMAGAIAHDFNNLLHVIQLNADLAGRAMNPDSKPAIYLERLMTTVKRAAELCSELLAYSGRGQYVMAPFSTDQLLDEMRSLAATSPANGVTVELTSDESSSIVNGDLSQIRQIVVNLVNNAREAVGDRPDGQINLRVETHDYDAVHFENDGFVEKLPPGRYVCILAEDNGDGMESDLQKKIFDPFFTTNDTRHGMGLSAVLGIVRGHQGTIQIESSPGSGTRFTVLLPLSELPDASLAEGVQEQPNQMSNLILFADDEADIRDLADAVMTQAGFSVIGAADGREAVEIFKERHEELRLVILDLTMPNKTGLEAYLEMSEIDSSVPVVFSSGFNATELMDQLPQKTQASFLKKPYRADDLHTFVTNIIGPLH